MKVLSFGSMNMDYVYHVEHIVCPGETLMATGRSVNAGGKGLNQSIALSKAGLPVYQAGCVGEDGSTLLNALVKNGINIDFVCHVSGISGHTFIQVDQFGQNSIVVYSGENLIPTIDYIDSVFQHFNSGDILVLQNEIANIDIIMTKAAEKGMDIVFNPSPMSASIETFPLSLVDFFFVNETEGYEMTGETEPKKIITSMTARFQKAMVVLTLGKDGAMCAYDGHFYSHPAITTTVVDTTAAGDTFTGFFLATFYGGKTIEEALSVAVQASSVTVSRPGAADSIPDIEELQLL